MKVIHHKEDDSKFLHCFKEDIIKVLNDNSKCSEIGLVGYTNNSIVHVFKDIKETVNDRTIYKQAYSFCLINDDYPISDDVKKFIQ